VNPALVANRVALRTAASEALTPAAQMPLVVQAAPSACLD
jgi:hypothetical protein